MAILNVNTKISLMVKNDAKENNLRIGVQAHYYILLGKCFKEFPDKNFQELEKSVLERLPMFKITE